jgi:hypothetical protein
LFTSLVVSTHCPLQRTLPAGHAAHAPYWHVWVAGHTVPQAPQLAPSKFGSMQPAAHASCPAGQETVQWLAVHTLPALQALPQLPQLALSLVVSEHLPLQTV